jgi:hypothetical protein
MGVPNTKHLAILAIFHGNVVKLENAYQNLDNQPLTQLPCAFLFRSQLRKERDPRPRSLDADPTPPYSEALGVLPGLLI